MNREVVIQTQELTKVYSGLMKPSVLAVDHLNLEVGRGEVFGLLGPNGSGKTTTTKLLLGLIFPTNGSATVLGEPAGSIRAKTKIGFLPEESYLYRFLNAEETLDFYGRIFGLPRAVRKRRTDELIELVGLQHARKRSLRGYSKGMSRRIGLAQALVNDPELVFMDEPTSGLDPIGRKEVKQLIVRLKEQGKTVMLCTHLLPRTHRRRPLSGTDRAVDAVPCEHGTPRGDDTTSLRHTEFLVYEDHRRRTRARHRRAATR